jgi:hypothetical protein
VKPIVPKHLRRLKSNELVSMGDFVVNESKALELWEGPNGFLADSFLKPIYRKDESHATATKKLK